MSIDNVSHDLKFCHFVMIFWGASRGLGPSKIDAGKEGCINYMHLSTTTNQCNAAILK